MNQRILFLLLWLLCLPAAVGIALAGEPQPNAAAPVVMDTITVQDKLLSPTSQGGDLLHTGTRVNAAGIALAGAGAPGSIFAALNLLPGINTEMQDPLGIAGKDMRLRGIRSRYASLSVEGIPNYGIMPIGPRDDIYDLENLESIGVYQGATPLGLGAGSGNRGGAITLEYRRPAPDFQLDLRQQLGSDDARRTFVRLDSGTLPTGTAFFTSYSHARADKWKGSGDLGPRRHATIGLTQPLGKLGQVELFYNCNDVERHDFKPLSYAEADHINDSYRHDYHGHLTGNPATDINYYDYHRGAYRNSELLAIYSWQPAPGSQLTLKPYYSSEEGFTMDGKADKVRDLKRYGIRTDYRGRLGDFSLAAGYWYEAHDLIKYVRANRISAAGRQYAGWKYLSDNHGYGDIHSPYLQVGRRFGNFTCQAGIKYFSYSEPASTAYRGSAAAGTPYDYRDALAHNLGEDAALSLDKMTYDEWLPSLALGYQWSSSLEMYVNYGRNYMRPYAYVPVANVYAANRARFQAAGMVLQDIIDDWRLETSDNIDVGIRYFGDRFDLQPTFFFARHHDLLALAYDPRVGVNYHQNVGDATAVGAEVEINIYPTPNLLLFINPCYTRLRFDDDLEQGGTFLPIKGNQLPDTPEILLKTGLIYTWGNLEIAPTFKFVGRRYGDPQNDQRISSHGLVDLVVRYTREKVFALQSVTAELAVSNLFDRKYVSGIVPLDDGSGTAYYAGPPFAAVFSLRARF